MHFRGIHRDPAWQRRSASYFQDGKEHRVEKVEDVMNVGDIVKVKVTEIDSQNRINLSRKELL